MKTSKKTSKKSRELEKEATKLLKTSRYYERKGSLEHLTLKDPMGREEHRQILGPGTRKPISIRIPEGDLTEIQKIAKINGRKYQQLIVKAVELYIDNYYRQMKIAKKKKFRDL